MKNRHAVGNRTELLKMVEDLPAETDAAKTAEKKACAVINKAFSKTGVSGVMDLWWAKTQLGSMAFACRAEEGKDIYLDTMGILERNVSKVQI